ncbi:MAG: hypothetical protein ABSH28_07970 [Acidobacteriota bacterium]|jgi:hypothetical protein
MKSSGPGPGLGFAYSGLLDNYPRTLGVEQHSAVYPIFKYNEEAR